MNHISTLAFACLLATASHANNIQVSGAVLTNVTATHARVQFDMSWENSWRGGGVLNWDAAWVFVKFRTGTNAGWRHANLDPTGHVIGADGQIDAGLLDPRIAFDAATNPVVGVFIHRSAEGAGDLSLPGVQLNWDFGALGLESGDIAQVQVFAIEMVYVPQGPFSAGSISSEPNSFTQTTINTAIANTAPTGAGALGGMAGGYPTGQSVPAASWPNGFNAFYCMKYEISQQGYVDFLNSLTYDQQTGCTVTAPNSAAGTGALVAANTDRNGIDLRVAGNPTTRSSYSCNLDGDAVYDEAMDGKDIACNYLSWGSLTAYLDWSGLRPMTELEFEKACRGPLLAVALEYAWGNSSIPILAYSLENAGGSNERIASNYVLNTAGNAAYGPTLASILGPLRCGIFAAHVNNTGRISSGATYYGIMEMSGNVYEHVVTIGHAQGLLFTGAHGNGGLTATGAADPGTWPSASTAQGAGLRGGSWSSPAITHLRLADRSNANYPDNAAYNDVGGRGVRTAP